MTFQGGEVPFLYSYPAPLTHGLTLGQKSNLGQVNQGRKEPWKVPKGHLEGLGRSGPLLGQKDTFLASNACPK